MKSKSQKDCPTSGKAHVRLLLLFAAVPLLSLATTYPAWWQSSGVLVTNGVVVTNDFAPATLGQLKWITTKAAEELATNAPGGAGTNLLAIVASFASTNNYGPVTIGQAKNVAKAIHDRLMEFGYETNYPWTASSADDNDFVPLLIGQLKTLFNFDLQGGVDSDSDGMPDWWESAKGLNPSDPGDAIEDTDNDGWSNLAEYINATNPSNDSSHPTHNEMTGLTLYTPLE